MSNMLFPTIILWAIALGAYLWGADVIVSLYGDIVAGLEPSE